MYSLAFLALLPAAFALPHAAVRQSTEPSCGTGGFDTGYGFQLSAYNITDATIPLNDTGVPLTVATVNELGAVSVGALATASSVASSNYLPSYYNGYFNLSSGSLVPLGFNTYTSDYESYWGQLQWQWSGEPAELGPSAQIYCGIANTDPYGGGNPYPTLAVDGDANNFYLCQAEYYEEVIHSPNPNSTVYNYDTCYPITVHVIQAFD